MGLIIMMLLGSMGTALVLLSKTDMEIATNYRDGMAAQYLAEAGIHHGASKLTNDHEFVSKTGINNYVITSESLGIMPLVGRYTVQIGPASQPANPNTRLIIATGIIHKAQRQVVATITLPTATGGLNSMIIMWNN